MFRAYFNGMDCMAYRIIPIRRPSVPAPEERVEEIEVPGRDGVLVISDETYKPIVIPIEFNFMSQPDEWQKTYRKAKRWLTGNGELIFSDDADCYYKVLHCKISDSERTSLKIGVFTAEFTCNPYTYYTSGKQEIKISHAIYNPGARCSPVYRITGEGMCIIEVNGKEFKANVGQEIVIDTDRMLSYKSDGTLRNTDVNGDYQNLQLLPGDNEIIATPGFDVFVKPGWREL